MKLFFQILAVPFILIHGLLVQLFMRLRGYRYENHKWVR